MNKTKIVATPGPGTGNEEQIVALIKAGLTSHAAVVGRKLNIPVACNVRDAVSQFFSNGQLVFLDGTAGRISYGSVSLQ
jgi:phosphohistidine swiveling domain-containing protein